MVSMRGRLRASTTSTCSAPLCLQPGRQPARGVGRRAVQRGWSKRNRQGSGAEVAAAHSGGGSEPDPKKSLCTPTSPPRALPVQASTPAAVRSRYSRRRYDGRVPQVQVVQRPGDVLGQDRHHDAPRPQQHAHHCLTKERVQPGLRGAGRYRGSAVQRKFGTEEVRYRQRRSGRRKEGNKQSTPHPIIPLPTHTDRTPTPHTYTDLDGPRRVAAAQALAKVEVEADNGRLCAAAMRGQGR